MASVEQFLESINSQVIELNQAMAEHLPEWHALEIRDLFKVIDGALDDAIAAIAKVRED